MAGLKDYRPRFGYDIRIKPDPAPAPVHSQHPCAHPACLKSAQSRVPRSRDNLEERIWLCRQHLRVHNETWNYFAGMTEAEIARYCVEAIVGHRPTWALGRRTAGTRNGAEKAAYWTYRIEDGFAIFEEAAEPAAPRPRPTKLTKGQLDALAILNLEESATLAEVKARYKELVKRFHPDANGGNRGTEERLRLVIKAYSHLRLSGFARNAA